MARAARSSPTGWAPGKGTETNRTPSAALGRDRRSWYRVMAPRLDGDLPVGQTSAILSVVVDAVGVPGRFSARGELAANLQRGVDPQSKPATEARPSVGIASVGETIGSQIIEVR